MRLTSVVFVACSLAAGCITPASDPLQIELDPDQDGKADGVTRPSGMFDDGALGNFNNILLNADHTYTWNNDVDDSEGTYKWGKSGEMRFLLLYEYDTNDVGGTPDSQATYRYQYTYSDQHLRLRQAPGGDLHPAPNNYGDWWTMLQISDEGEICVVADVTHQPCSGDLVCQKSQTSTVTICTQRHSATPMGVPAPSAPAPHARGSRTRWLAECECR